MAPRPDRDAVDDLIDQWRRERPELDYDAMAVWGRLGRLTAVATRAIEAGFAPHGLNLGEFDVLAALRRAGDPFELSPGALVTQLMLSPSAMTNRIDRLEAGGWVRRRPDPTDRRGVLVALTPEGRALIDRAVTDHVANETALLAGLTRAEVRQLDTVVRKLLASLATDRP